MTASPERADAAAGGTGEKDLLRLLTCGSVDDGKSTLIGRLLYDTRRIFADQLSALEQDSKAFGTTGEAIDFALLLDGLEAEREQKITIDVGYRYFSTGKRSFIIADTPGHEQFTRNMATGASNSELAVILVDARKGIVVQTRRHATICSLLGVAHVVLAVNKIDLVEFDQGVFEEIVADFVRFASGRHTVGRVRAAGSKGPLFKGPKRSDQEFHRHRFALRTSGRAGASAADHARECGATRRPGDRASARGGLHRLTTWMFHVDAHRRAEHHASFKSPSFDRTRLMDDIKSGSWTLPKATMGTSISRNDT